MEFVYLAGCSVDLCKIFILRITQFLCELLVLVDVVNLFFDFFFVLSQFVQKTNKVLSVFPAVYIICMHVTRPGIKTMEVASVVQNDFMRGPSLMRNFNNIYQVNLKW